MNKKLYYALNLTWGLPLTLIGLTVALILLISGKKPKKFGGCLHFEIGEKWGGVNLGLVIVTQKNVSESTKSHELGHSIQNALYGPFMLIIVAIPSVVRYWYREIRERRGYKNSTCYDSIWFEKQATEFGEKYTERLF